MFTVVPGGGNVPSEAHSIPHQVDNPVHNGRLRQMKRTMTDAPDQTRELWTAVLSQLSSDDRITPQLHGFINLVEPKGVLAGTLYLEVPNEPEALVVNYYLKADATGAAKITVKDPGGRMLREIEGPAKRGLNRALVPLAGGGGGRGGGGAAGGGRGRGGTPTPPLAIGDYTVTIDVAGQTLTKPARVRERIGR